MIRTRVSTPSVGRRAVAPGRSGRGEAGERGWRLDPEPGEDVALLGGEAGGLLDVAGGGGQAHVAAGRGVVAQRALGLDVRLLDAARDRLATGAGGLRVALQAVAVAQRVDPLKLGLDALELGVALGAVALGLGGVVAD